MLAVLATFLLCLAIVLGAYWAFVVIPEDKSARQLRKRLKADVVIEGRSPADGLTRRAAPLSALKGLDALLGKSGRLVDPLRQTVEQSGLSITIGLVVLASVFAASSGFLIIRLATGLTWAAGVVAIAAGSVPYLLVRYAAVRRTRLFEDQFPQAIDLIASSLRAGHAFTSGISMVSDEVADPTGAEFRLLYDQQNFGMPLPDALKAFSTRVPLLDARFFITAVLTQREAGGNLAEVLDNLSELIRERSRVKRQVRVASAHGRITGWVLSMMPPALFLVMMLIAPEHMNTFVTDPIGIRMILLALALQVIGTFAIRRIVNVEF
jgi:tight adherence protein B